MAEANGAISATPSLDTYHPLSPAPPYWMLEGDQTPNDSRTNIVTKLLCPQDYHDP
jgi:hypothetical protein